MVPCRASTLSTLSGVSAEALAALADLNLGVESMHTDLRLGLNKGAILTRKHLTQDIKA